MVSRLYTTWTVFKSNYITTVHIRADMGEPASRPEGTSVQRGHEREAGASVARQKGERGRMRRRGGRGGKKTPRVERGQEGGGKGVKAGREGVRERAGSAGENDGKGRRRRWRETAWSGPDGRGGPALHDGAGELVGGE